MKYAKAILAGVIALVGGIAVGYADDTLTKGEFWAAAAAAAVALGGVFQIPNQDGDLGEDGTVAPGFLWFLAAVVLAVVLLELVGHPVRVG